MIRERVIQNWTFTAGSSSSLDLPRDAVYHIIQIEGTGVFSNVQGAGGTGVVFDDCFPFSILKNIRLLRNGSDVVYQSSGCLLAKEHYFLNETFPHARLYTITNSVETLLTSATGALALGAKGVTVPANAEGLGMSQVEFATANTPSTTITVNFDFQVDLYLQMGPSDVYYGTLVDARRLATYQLVIDFANVTDFAIPGTTNTNTMTAVGRILSYDQDNVKTDIDWGTFKRSQQGISNIPYGSSNQQIALTRGNYFHGVIVDCLAFKANSTTVPAHENACLVNILNRINTNFQLRNTNFEDLQRKVLADGCAVPAFYGGRGTPNGTGYLYFPCTGDRGAELVPTHVLDLFDLLVQTASGSTVAGPGNQAVNGPENGITTASTNPIFNILLEEIIPGVALGDSFPTAAQAGSRRATSAKPYSR